MRAVQVQIKIANKPFSTIIIRWGDAMRIRRQFRLWFFSATVILLMLAALGYSYPGGLKDVAEMSEQVVALITGK